MKPALIQLSISHRNPASRQAKASNASPSGTNSATVCNDGAVTLQFPYPIWKSASFPSTKSWQTVTTVTPSQPRIMGRRTLPGGRLSNARPAAVSRKEIAEQGDIRPGDMPAK